LGGALSAIAAIIAQRPLLPILRQGHAGIGGHRHEVAQVAGVAHRRIDALIGETADDDEISGAEIAQHVIDVGGDEHRGGGLGEHDFIVGGRKLRHHLGVGRTLGHVKSGDLVIERAVAPVGGLALDHGIGHFDAAAAAGLLQTHHVGQRAVLQGAEEIAVALFLFGGAEPRVFAPVPAAIEVLHVDDQESGVLGFDLDFAAERLIIATLQKVLVRRRAAHR
jgi:hypothetical protein